MAETVTIDRSRSGKPATVSASALAARCSPDMVVRRNIDAVAMQIRRAAKR